MATGRSPMGQRLVVIAILFVFSPGLTHAKSPTTPYVARGEVFMLTSELAVVIADDGMREIFRLDKTTRVDPAITVGDRVEIRLTPDHRVLSITKLTLRVVPMGAHPPEPGSRHDPHGTGKSPGGLRAYMKGSGPIAYGRQCRYSRSS